MKHTRGFQKECVAFLSNRGRWSFLSSGRGNGQPFPLALRVTGWCGKEKSPSLGICLCRPSLIRALFEETVPYCHFCSRVVGPGLKLDAAIWARFSTLQMRRGAADCRRQGCSACMKHGACVGAAALLMPFRAAGAWCRCGSLLMQGQHKRAWFFSSTRKSTREPPWRLTGSPQAVCVILNNAVMRVQR